MYYSVFYSDPRRSSGSKLHSHSMCTFLGRTQPWWTGWYRGSTGADRADWWLRWCSHDINFLNLVLLHPIRCPCFSTQIEHFLRPYTLHFIHEFYFYATSSFDDLCYDRSFSFEALDRAMSTPSNTYTTTEDEDSDVSVACVSRHGLCQLLSATYFCSC